VRLDRSDALTEHGGQQCVIQAMAVGEPEFGVVALGRDDGGVRMLVEAVAGISGPCVMLGALEEPVGARSE